MPRCRRRGPRPRSLRLRGHSTSDRPGPLTFNLQPLHHIRERLLAAGVVQDALTLRLAMRWTGASRDLQAGEYRFDRPMTAVEVVSKIARGDVYGQRITFPEGLTIREMAALYEHGANNYSLYGYLGSISVQRGASVDAGTELGRSGSAPAGPPALYLEMRIDGRPVDPLQWLKRL